MDTLGPDLEDTVAAELVHLQRAAYAVEAALVGDDRIPPLHEGPADLRAARLRWFVVREAAGLVAAVGFTEHDGEVDIDRLVVHPSQHRRGLGRRLVERVLRDAERAVVATGRDNAPARGLYAALGFDHRGDREVLDGLWVSEYAWSRASPMP